MSNIVQKLSSYQVLANLLPGVFFVWLIRLLFHIEIPALGLIEDIISFYFLGFIINRIGSLVTEPILTAPIGKRKFKLVEHLPYSEYLSASKVDAKIDILSETNDSFRSFLTSILILPIAYGLFTLYSRWLWFHEYWRWVAVVFLIVLFFFSYRSQTKYICERIKESISTMDE